MPISSDHNSRTSSDQLIFLQDKQRSRPSPSSCSKMGCHIVHRLLGVRCLQRSNVAICRGYHLYRPQLARGNRHRCVSILHRQLRHCIERCDWRHTPRAVSRSREGQLGLLGQLHCHCVSCNTCYLLVCDPDYERRQYRQGYAG